MWESVLKDALKDKFIEIVWTLFIVVVLIYYAHLYTRYVQERYVISGTTIRAGQTTPAVGTVSTDVGNPTQWKFNGPTRCSYISNNRDTGVCKTATGTDDPDKDKWMCSYDEPNKPKAGFSLCCNKSNVGEAPTKDLRINGKDGKPLNANFLRCAISTTVAINRANSQSTAANVITGAAANSQAMQSQTRQAQAQVPRRIVTAPPPTPATPATTAVARPTNTATATAASRQFTRR